MEINSMFNSLVTQVYPINGWVIFAAILFLVIGGISIAVSLDEDSLAEKPVYSTLDVQLVAKPIMTDDGGNYVLEIPEKYTANVNDEKATLKEQIIVPTNLIEGPLDSNKEYKFTFTTTRKSNDESKVAPKIDYKENK